jgi:hypothetical protein
LPGPKKMLPPSNEGTPLAPALDWQWLCCFSRLNGERTWFVWDGSMWEEVESEFASQN